jgi:hypothetical protein
MLVILLLVFITYYVASVFISIFVFSTSTILHCFLLDEELGGSKHTPDSLKDFLDVCDREDSNSRVHPTKEETKKEAANDMA